MIKVIRIMEYDAQRRMIERSTEISQGPSITSRTSNRLISLHICFFFMKTQRLVSAVDAVLIGRGRL